MFGLVTASAAGRERKSISTLPMPERSWPWPKILAMAEEAANAVPHPAPEGFRRVWVVVDDKGDSGSLFDPVTAVGRNLEEAIRDVPARQRPNDAVIREEFGKTVGDSGPPWVIDPIDGTRPFLAGPPLWPSMSAPATAPAGSSA